MWGPMFLRRGRRAYAISTLPPAIPASPPTASRALYASYNGPLYQVKRQSGGRTLNIGVVQPVASPVPDAGGYADAAAQDAFYANTYCWITTIYDQSPEHNDLTRAPRGGFSGPDGLAEARQVMEKDETMLAETKGQLERAEALARDQLIAPAELDLDRANYQALIHQTHADAQNVMQIQDEIDRATCCTLSAETANQAASAPSATDF